MAGGIGVSSLTALSGVWFGMPEPLRCSWCIPSSFDQRLSSSLAWSNKKTPDVISDVVVYAVLPALALTTAGYLASDSSRFALYAVTILDAVVLNFLVTEILKRAAARERPDGSDFLSFPSGHTSAAFALVSSSSVIAFKERSSWAPYILSGGVLLAGFAAYLRMAAAKHWPSDVLAGMAIGTAIGIATPFAVMGNWRVSPLSEGTGLQLTVLW